MEWLNIIICICILIFLFLDKFFWSKNRFDSMKAEIESLKTANNNIVDTLTARIAFLKEQQYDPKDANAEIKNKTERIQTLVQEKEELSKERSKLIEKIEQLSRDSENNIKLINELEKYKENSVILTKMQQVDRDNYQRIINELKLKENGIGAYFTEQIKIEKDIAELKKKEFCVFVTKTSNYAIIHRTNCRYVCQNKKGVADSKGMWWYKGFDSYEEATKYLKELNEQGLKQYKCKCNIKDEVFEVTGWENKMLSGSSDPEDI